MDDGLSSKCACQHCGTHLEFPRNAGGAEIDCPHCKEKTVLTLPEDFEGCPSAPQIEEGTRLSSGDLLASFTGCAPARPISRLYSLGLLSVAALMILLPAFYLAMIAAAA